MKTEQAVNDARTIVAANLQRQDLSPMQRAVLSGISVALCWVSDDARGSSLQALLDGVPIAPAGKSSPPPTVGGN